MSGTRHKVRSGSNSSMSRRDLPAIPISKLAPRGRLEPRAIFETLDPPGLKLEHGFQVGG